MDPVLNVPLQFQHGIAGIAQKVHIWKDGGRRDNTYEKDVTPSLLLLPHYKSPFNLTLKPIPKWFG